MTTSTQFRNILKSFAVVPLATIGVMASTAIAEAAALTGNFQIGGGFTVMSFSKDMIDFELNSNGQTLSTMGIISTDPQVDISTGVETNSFTQFESAFIEDIQLPMAGELSNFLDFSAGGLLDDNVKDGEDTFSLTKVSDFVVTQESQGILGINLEMFGYFTSATGEITKGKGILTFQYTQAGVTAEAFKARLNSGEVFEGITFSGAAMSTDVPEPATLLGLLGVGALGAAARKSKKEAES